VQSNPFQVLCVEVGKFSRHCHARDDTCSVGVTVRYSAVGLTVRYSAVGVGLTVRYSAGLTVRYSAVGVGLTTVDGRHEKLLLQIERGPSIK